jgi:hypothetical protein
MNNKLFDFVGSKYYIYLGYVLVVFTLIEVAIKLYERNLNDAILNGLAGILVLSGQTFLKYLKDNFM